MHQKSVSHYLWFNFQVKTGGPWDYKTQDKTYRPEKGEHSRYEAFGNFNYGATGLAAGFTEGQLLRLAGHVHTDPNTAEGEKPGFLLSLMGFGGKAPYGDSHEDQAQINAGFNYYQRKFVLKDCE